MTNKSNVKKLIFYSSIACAWVLTGVYGIWVRHDSNQKDYDLRERIHKEKLDMKHQHWLYNQGYKSKFGTKPGCDGKGYCLPRSSMSLQHDVKEQFRKE